MEYSFYYWHMMGLRKMGPVFVKNLATNAFFANFMVVFTGLVLYLVTF